ncbi:MAG: methylmalonyl-CoA mutase family protein [Propionibacteriaceae bacterium]|jgi:methylmalonyl-CoA mutase|nr:methylmalonyl-CoA mutase family protein [Propionibacteriaceae bacterium]
MSDEKMVLAGDFTQPTTQDWDREVLKIFNRKRPPGSELTLEQAMKRLTTVQVDGLVIDPLYTRPDDQAIGQPGQMPFTRGSAGRGPSLGWSVVGLHEDPDPARSNRAVLEDLAAGADGLWLRVDPDAIQPADLAGALAGVLPEAASISLSGAADQAGAAQALLDFWAASGQPGQVAGNLGIDPLGAAALTGQAPNLRLLAEWVAKAQGWGRVRALVVDTLVYDNAGAGDVEQLAYAVASGLEYVRALAAAGVDAATAFDQIAFRVAASADQFPTIARLRALRRLWARVGEVLGVPEAQRGAVQHAVTSWRNISRDDPWVNLLRGTIAAFAAAAGGAEFITVLPHDTAYGLPTKFSRRLARNIQLLVGEESHLGKVKDPAGGAWFVESITDQLARKAWAVVQELEAAGGFAVGLASGAVAQQIGRVTAERDKRLASRKLPLTGVSMFPKQDEEPLADFVPRPPRPDWAGLEPRRDSEVFEALRDRSTAHARATGAKPTVLLALLGARRDFGPREQFTTNLLLVAGLDYRPLEGPSPAEIVAAAQELGSSVVVLASSGKVYADQAEAAAAALKQAGQPYVYIAGRKAEASPEGQALIDAEFYDGIDVVAFLTETLDRLGVAK